MMDEIASHLLVLGVATFGILLMIGSCTKDPLEFACKTYKWLFRISRNLVRDIFLETSRILWRGVRAFCRSFPRTASIAAILTLGALAIIALAHAGFP